MRDEAAEKPDARRVAPISACVLGLRLVVAEPLPYYNNLTHQASYILHKHVATHWLSTLCLV